MPIVRNIVRTVMMVIITEVCLCLMGAGFDPVGLRLVGGFVVAMGTVPIFCIVLALTHLEKSKGSIGPIVIASGGLLPTIAIIFFGLSGERTDHTFVFMASGWLWGGGWLLTSRLTTRSSQNIDDEDD